jgi:formimidoylglutamate deiminase
VLRGGDLLEEAHLDVEDGTIVEISESDDVDGREPDDVVDLGDVAIVPGMVNAHSHAFQRAIRHRTEYLPADDEADDFWSWRERMYEAALTLDPDQFEAVSRMAFVEMARAGYTTVGEFHYLHHDREGEPYADPNELAHRVVRAARDAGLRIRLLRTAYRRAGYEQPSNPRQRRFVEPDVETYLERTRDLADTLTDRRAASVGLAPHSIRAVPSRWLSRIGEAAEALEMPVHIHASEQRGELEESRAEYGTTPIEAFAQLGILDERWTIVHGTHATRTEMELLEASGATVCACPTTERNLGDGIVPARELLEHDVSIALGSDSHADIDPWEEMRLVEYHERLQREERNVLARFAEADARRGGDRRTAEVLWPMGTEHGADALQLPVGRLESGRVADFVGLDLEALPWAGLDADHLLEGCVFSARSSAVREVVVDGERIVRAGEHSEGGRTVRAFEQHLPFD